MFDFINQYPLLDYSLRLLTSLICGFCLGFERKIRQHTVGIRTLTLISSSTALLSILSVYMAQNSSISGDPTRIAAAVITGIGFLGTGAIFHQGLNIRGLTSAAIIFCAAAIGLSCGAGLYIPAFITLLFALVTLSIMGLFEHKLFPAEKRKILKIEFSTPSPDKDILSQIITSYGIIIHDLDIKYNAVSSTTTLIFTIKTPDDLNPIKLTTDISKMPAFLSLDLNKY